MAEIKYEIKESIGIVSENGKGWIRELNFISWNDRKAKYDLRDWSLDHKKMSKGITLTVEEIKSLRDILNGIDLD